MSHDIRIISIFLNIYDAGYISFNLLIIYLLRLPNIYGSEKASNFRSTLYVHTYLATWYVYGHTCALMCIVIFGRIEIRPQKLSVQPSVVAKSGSRTRFESWTWTCGPFLFMKLPINARWQGFPFHSSTCPTRARHSLSLSLSVFVCASFSRIFIIFFLSCYLLFFLTKTWVTCNIEENILMLQKHIIINVNWNCVSLWRVHISIVQIIFVVPTRNLSQVLTRKTDFYRI